MGIAGEFALSKSFIFFLANCVFLVVRADNGAPLSATVPATPDVVETAISDSQAEAAEALVKKARSEATLKQIWKLYPNKAFKPTSDGDKETLEVSLGTVGDMLKPLDFCASECENMDNCQGYTLDVATGLCRTSATRCADAIEDSPGSVLAINRADFLLARISPEMNTDSDYVQLGGIEPNRVADSTVPLRNCSIADMSANDIVDYCRQMCYNTSACAQFQVDWASQKCLLYHSAGGPFTRHDQSITFALQNDLPECQANQSLALRGEDDDLTLQCQALSVIGEACQVDNDFVANKNACVEGAECVANGCQDSDLACCVASGSAPIETTDS